MTDGAVRKRGKEAQTLRADLSTKHVGDDSEGLGMLNKNPLRREEIPRVKVTAR
jgi:hypothetical protein